MLVIKDFATTTLAAALTAGATSIVVSDASRLPTLSAGDYFYLVLQKFTDRSYVEIVKVTGVASNTLTVVRAQAGSTAKAFAIGDYAELRLTKGTFDEYLAQAITGKVDIASGYVQQKLDLLNAADLVKAGVGVVYDATNGHGTVLSGGEGANKLTPHILLRPRGMADDSVQAKYGADGSLILTGGSRYVETGLLSMKHPSDANGWPNATNSDANNYNNRARGMIRVNNNALYFIADAALNARRFGIQSGHERPDYATAYGILDLNPFGGVVRVNGGTVYHTGYVPTPAAVGALALSGGILTGPLEQNIGGYGVRLTAGNGFGYLQGGKVGGDTTDQKLRITGINSAPLTDFDIITSGHGVARVNGARIYTEQYVPTPDVLGVVPQARTINSKPLTSDIVLSPDDIGSPAGRSETKDFTGAAGVWVRIARIRAPQSTSTFKITLTGGSGFNSGALVYTNKVEIIARAYNNNPKGLGLVAVRNFQSGSLFSELCSVNVSGDDYDIYVKSVGSYGQRCIAEYFVASGVLLDTTHIHTTTSAPSGAVMGQMFDLYSTGFKPTAEDVGALALTGGTVTGALLTSVNDAMAIRARRAGYWALMGCSSTAGEYLFGGGADSFADYHHYIRIGNAKFQFQTGGAAYNVFHEGFVPTAAAVGAAPTGFGLGAAAIQKTAQDQTQAGFWRDAAITMAGVTLPYDGSPSQAFIGVNALNKRLKFGFRTGATTAPIEWFEAYSDNNKPTAAALGVVPASSLEAGSGAVMLDDGPKIQAVVGELANFASVAALSPFRNKIHNGKFEVSQRGASIPIPVNTTVGTIDRFNIGNSTSARGTVNQAIVDVSYPNTTVRKCMRLALTAAVPASVPVSEQLRIAHCIEGYEVRSLQARPFTLSFTARTTKAGTYCVALRNASRTKTILREYDLPANVWTPVVLPFSELPQGFIVNWESSIGLEICWTLASGSSYFGASQGGALDGALLCTSKQVVWGTSTSDTFSITEVQLEVGSKTDFEHRPYPVELALCQRYLLGIGWADGVSGTLASGGMCTASVAIVSIGAPVQMRATPSFEGGTLSLVSGSGAIGTGTPTITLRGPTIMINQSITGAVGQSSYLTSSQTSGFRGFVAELV